MEYISAKDAASKWGISKRRVAVLAKSGRINGASQVGRNWIIPANADKPTDPRKEVAVRTGSKIICPLFFHKFGTVQNGRNDLNPEGQLLFDAQECFLHNDLKKAERIVKKLIQESGDTYILIGCFLTLGYTSIELKDVDQYERCILELHFIFTYDFPAKKELLYLVKVLEAYREAKLLSMEQYHIDPSEQFDPQFQPYILSGFAYNELIGQTRSRQPADTSMLELVCAGIDHHGCYYTSQELHVYLACIYSLTGNTEFCTIHLRKVMDLAVKYDSYYPLAICSQLLREQYERLLSAYPKFAAEKLHARCKNYIEGTGLIDERCSVSPEGLNALSLKDYDYIVYALRGMKNREIARIKGISEISVCKHYSVIYNACGVKGKKELVKMIRNSVLKGESCREWARSGIKDS